MFTTEQIAILSEWAKELIGAIDRDDHYNLCNFDTLEIEDNASPLSCKQATNILCRAGLNIIEFFGQHAVLFEYNGYRYMLDFVENIVFINKQ